MKLANWLIALTVLTAGCSGDSSIVEPSETSRITGYIVAHTSSYFGGTEPAIELAASATNSKPVYLVHYDPATIRSQSGMRLSQADLVIGRRVVVTTRAAILLSDPMIVSRGSITVLD